MTPDKRLDGWKLYDLHVAPEGSTLEQIQAGISAIFLANSMQPFYLWVGTTTLYIHPAMNRPSVVAAIEATIPKETH